MKNKLISLCLAASVAAGALWGCAGQGGTGVSQDSPSAKTASEETTGGNDVPKGRYVENSIPISLEPGERAADLLMTEDNKLELFTVMDQKARRYLWTGERWERQEKSFMEGLEFTYDSYHMVKGEDGNRYVIYQGGSDYRTYMMKLEEGKEPVSLLDDVFSVKSERGYYQNRPDYVAVAADGSILLSQMRESLMYSPQGQLLFSVPQDSSSVEWQNAHILSDNRYITMGTQGYLIYDISSGSSALAGDMAFQSTEIEDLLAPITSDGAGGFFIVNSRGIHHMHQGGELWETVCDGSLNSLSLPSAFLKKLFTGSENDFFVWMSQSDTEEIKHYTYDEEMPSVPSETLTVYGLDLDSSATIRQAAAMFQLGHPNVKVELISGRAEGGSTSTSDTIRALNTELLGGNGADILVLDGLPVDSYMEKGVLEDMSGLLEPMITSGELLEQITTPYTDENGGIYQIPSRMLLLAAYGDPEAIRSLGSMKAMRSYQSDASHLPLRPKTNYRSLLTQVLTLSYEEIVDRESGRLRPGKIQELLETAKLLGEACGAKVVFDESEDGGMGRVYNYNFSQGKDGFIGNEYFYVDQEQSAVAIEKIKGMQDTILPLAVMKKRNLTLENINLSYIASGLMGINQSSPRKELAEQFILYVLSMEIQKDDLSDGLPVNAKAVTAWIEKDRSSEGSLYITGGDGNYQIGGSLPDQEERRMIFETAARAVRPIRTDRVIMEIITDETMGYFEGSLSLEQAVQNAENKAGLYFAE